MHRSKYGSKRTEFSIDCIFTSQHCKILHSIVFSSQCASSLSRPRNGNRRGPLTAADAEKSSSYEIGLDVNVTLRAAARLHRIVSPSVRVAGGDNVLCETLWTDLMVLGSRKCSSPGRSRHHSPQYCSSADLGFFVSVRPFFFIFFFINNSTKIGHKMYLCLLVVPHSITQNSIHFIS